MTEPEPTEEVPQSVIHVAATPCQLNHLVHQVCAWCGELLIAADMTPPRILTPDYRPPMALPPGGFVERFPDGVVQPYHAGAVLTPRHCAAAAFIPPETEPS